MDATSDAGRQGGDAKALVQDVAEVAAAFVEPITDNKGSEAYKRSLLKGLVKRAFDIVERRRRGRHRYGDAFLLWIASMKVSQ